MTKSKIQYLRKADKDLQLTRRITEQKKGTLKEKKKTENNIKRTNKTVPDICRCIFRFYTYRHA